MGGEGAEGGGEAGDLRVLTGGGEGLVDSCVCIYDWHM